MDASPLQSRTGRAVASALVHRVASAGAAKRQRMGQVRCVHGKGNPSLDTRISSPHLSHGRCCSLPLTTRALQAASVGLTQHDVEEVIQYCNGACEGGGRAGGKGKDLHECKRVGQHAWVQVAVNWDARAVASGALHCACVERSCWGREGQGRAWSQEHRAACMGAGGARAAVLYGMRGRWHQVLGALHCSNSPSVLAQLSKHAGTGNNMPCTAPP